MLLSFITYPKYTQRQSLISLPTADAKDRGGQVNTGCFDLFHKFRTKTGWPHMTENFSILQTRLFENKQVGRCNNITLHATYFGENVTLRDPSRRRSSWTIIST